jgi:hypothetical protein
MANAVDFSKAIWLGFDHVEDLLVKSAHELVDADRVNYHGSPMPSGLAKLFWHYNDGGASSNPTDPGLRRDFLVSVARIRSAPSSLWVISRHFLCGHAHSRRGVDRQ